LNKLASAYRHKITKKTFWVCNAEGCNTIYSGNLSQNRVLPHCASSCKSISTQLKREANDALVITGEKSLPISWPPAKKTKTAAEENRDPPQTSCAGQSWFQQASELGCQDFQSKIDSDVVLLVCVGGMVPALIDRNIWKTFMGNLNPKYMATSLKTIRDKLIPAQVAVVRRDAIDVLKGEFNLTLTFDGGSTRGKQSV